MIQPRDERTPPMTPQLALRVAIVGSVALALFAIVFFRLWFLQVLSGDKYVAYASRNTTRYIPIAAPRGEILASNGTALVDSVQVPAIQIVPLDLPEPISFADLEKDPGSQPQQDYGVYDALAKLLKMSTKPQLCAFQLYLGGPPKQEDPELAPIPCLVAQGIANAQYAPVTIKTDVPADVSYYIQERQTEHQFEGVVGDAEVSLRQYPYGKQGLAAQVLGYVSAISGPETKQSNFAGAQPGDIVGQTGLEYHYNQELSGTDGDEAVKVNAANEFEGYGRVKSPQPGDNLQTSLDLRLEQVGDTALAQSISSYPGADGGAFVALSPTTGQIYAMGSNPTYDPSIFTQPISTKTYDKDFGASSNAPLINRAIQGAGPDGSTFKVITATAALESGAWGLNDSYDDVNCYKADATAPCQHNSGDSSYGPTNLVKAIQDSVDTFFYNLGGLMNVDPMTHPQGGALQDWAKQFGIGQKTGVDLPGEDAGTLPSPAWRAQRNKLEQECDTATGVYSYTNGHGAFSSKPEPGYHPSPKHKPGGCELVVWPPESWSIGDNVNMAVGQGDVQVTPLQLAVAYAALANPNGAVVTPHVGEDVVSPSGTIVQKIDPAPKRYLHIDPVYRDAILTGLRDAATSGTSADVMGDFPEQVYGKTGTAQYGTAEQIATNTESDYAWYACFVPATATSKPIVVVVWVEKGGFGDVSAAPVARQILSQWFLGKPGPYKSGSNSDL